MRRLIYSIVLTAVLALTAVPAFSSPYDQKPGHGKKSLDPFLNGEPFTLDQVLLLLKQDAIPMHRRKEAIESLDAAGHPWRIAAVSPSLAGLWALGIAGLGVTVRSALGVPRSLVSHKTLFDLPRLGAFPVTLHAAAGGLSPGVERLRDILRDVVVDYLS